MTSHPPHSASPEIPDNVVVAHVERMRRSPTFAKSERLSRFLGFVVDETLAGRAETLKEQVIASALYSHESGSNSVVRVDARRLRDKLREYYAEFPGDSIEITIPKGSYIPQFESTGVTSAATDERIQPRSARRPLRTRIILPAAVIAAALAILYLSPFAPRDVEFTPVPLTSFPGMEDSPSLSPDGNFVAFSWTGREGGPRHIYIKAVGGDAVQQLTKGTGENSPVWSPDGRHIAFVRNPRGVYVSSAIGGVEMLISEVGSYAAWTADCRALLVREPGPAGPHGIVQVSIETKEKRQITQATVGDGDWRFEVSPDGKTLAFIRYGRSGLSDLYLVPIQGGNPKRITNWNISLGGVAWTPHGRELVYSVEESTGTRLWRIASNVSSPEKGRRIAGTGWGIGRPSISRPARGRPVRLAYDARITDIGLRIVDLAVKSRDGEFVAVERVADSSRGEQPGRWSSDAEQLAFVSDRDGDMAIWTCKRDGSGLQKLAPQNGTLAWSPDRKSIAFDSVDNGNTELYVVSSNGGQPRRLTSDPGIDGTPEWSHDGNSIYFTSTRAAQTAQLWRMPAEGGPATQITRRGGFRPRESPDGRFLYYLDRLPSGMHGRGRLMRAPVRGGEEVEVLQDIGGWTWDATDSGIVFLTLTQGFSAVDLLRYEDHTTVRLGHLPFRPSGTAVGWAVSRDGRWLLTNRIDRLDADLMFIDNFR
jgi:Tol biopolymer transport system component